MPTIYHGAIHMVITQNPTHWTHHVELKHFIILKWTNNEFIDFMETSIKNIHTVTTSKKRKE